jgi:hypothetical protein
VKRDKQDRLAIDGYDSSALLVLMDITPEQCRKAARVIVRHSRDTDDLRNLLHAVGLLHDPDCKPRAIY